MCYNVRVHYMIYPSSHRIIIAPYDDTIRRGKCIKMALIATYWGMHTFTPKFVTSVLATTKITLTLFPRRHSANDYLQLIRNNH